MSDFLHKGPCPKCGSRDNLGTYSDGHTYCFGCGHYEHGAEGTPSPRTEKRMSGDLIPAGEAMALAARRLTAETCSKWGYTVGEMRGQKVQIATYRDITGRPVAQKVRFANKDFVFLGDGKAAGLYGMHLWRDGGRRVVVTEGEIDALSVSQVQGNKWPVVSLPKGAKAAAKDIGENIQWLLTFEEVVLMFDNDDPGRDAAAECATLFPPGRCKIAKLPLKDANEMLKAGRDKELIGAIFEAKTFRPDGVVTIGDVKDEALKPVTMGLPWFTPILSRTLYGRRLGEIIAIGAGTGVGKTELLAEQIYYDMAVLNEPVAVFLLEQQPYETVQRMAGKQAGKSFHVPNRDGEEPRWTADGLRDAIGVIEGHRLFMYDSFGATDWERIATTIRFLSHSECVRLFYLDHLTALAAAEDDERTGLEKIMSELGSLVKELHVTVILVSHLSTPTGTPHEEGGRVMIRHFKGSRAIGFWSHTMIGLERNQQSDDPIEKATTTFRVLKHRPVGSAVGEKVFFRYDSDIGRLIELDHNPFEESDGGPPVVSGDAAF